MKKIIIVAKSDNRVIGKNNDLPWSLPADERFFKQQITDGFLLTGRASFESPQGREVFADRSDVVVITRQPDYQVENGLVAHSVDAGIQKAAAAGARRLYILGGGAIYRQTIDLANELIVTEVHIRIEGETLFPPIDPQHWQEVWREDHRRDEENPLDYSFVRFERRFI